MANCLSGILDRLIRPHIYGVNIKNKILNESEDILMKNNRFKGVITLVVVTIISFAIIIVSKLALRMRLLIMIKNQQLEGV